MVVVLVAAAVVEEGHAFEAVALVVEEQRPLVAVVVVVEPYPFVVVVVEVAFDSVATVVAAVVEPIVH